MMRKPCCEKQDTNKGAWSKQEDEKLMNYILKHGQAACTWRNLPQAAGLLRCGKSCRLRWINYLKPDLKRGNFTEDEQDLIIKLHALLGNRWSLIAGRLPGRTDNEVKNYWNSHLRRKLMKMGIDPNNHRLAPPHQHISSSSSSSLSSALVSPVIKMISEPKSRISDLEDDNINYDDHHNKSSCSDGRSTIDEEERRELHPISHHHDAHDHDHQQINYNKLIIPDLNLDLAINTININPSPNFNNYSVVVGAECSGRRLESEEIHELASCTSPTLLLFP